MRVPVSVRRDVATGDKPWLEGRAAGTTEGYRCGESLVRFEYFVASRVVTVVCPQFLSTRDLRSLLGVLLLSG